MFNMEDMMVRWAVLRNRWLESNHVRDAAFLADHGQKMHKAHSRAGLCFRESKHIRNTNDVIREKVEAMKERREIWQCHVPRTHEKAWRAATKEYLPGRENKESKLNTVAIAIAASRHLRAAYPHSAHTILSP